MTNESRRLVVLLSNLSSQAKDAAALAAIPHTKAKLTAAAAAATKAMLDNANRTTARPNTVGRKPTGAIGSVLKHRG